MATKYFMLLEACVNTKDMSLADASTDSVLSCNIMLECWLDFDDQRSFPSELTTGWEPDASSI